MSNLSPLGKPVTYTGQYDAGLLCPLDRRRSRDAIGVPAQLQFFGADIWNAYELSWLNERGKPNIAIATFCVPGGNGVRPTDAACWFWPTDAWRARRCIAGPARSRYRD